MTYIAPKAKVLAHVDRLVAWRRGLKPAPVTVEWDLSNRCALGCQSCHFAHTHTRGPWASKPRVLPMAYDSGGDLADMGVVERAVNEMGRAGVKAIVWSGGGEPTTHPKWPEAILLAAERGLQQGMYTFGGLLEQESAHFLANHLEWVVVSLDAADAETYLAEKGVDKFEAACQGIRYLAEAKSTVVGVSFLIHADNWKASPKMLLLARDLGSTYVTFRPTIDVSQDAQGVPAKSREWIDKALDTLKWLAQGTDVEVDLERFKQYRDWNGHGYSECEGIKLNATITPDGRVWPCPQRRGCAGSCLGDLRYESFGDIWARHPGRWTVDAECRVMCRLHPVNQQIAAMSAPLPHEAFV